MSCDFSKEKLVSYLYREGDEQLIASVESHLQNCPECMAIIDEMRSTSALLKQWPDEVPNLRLSFAREPVRHNKFTAVFSAFKRRPFSSGIAAGIAACFLILALLNFEAHFENNKVSITVGLVSDRISNENAVSRAEFQKWQIQSVKLMDQMLRESEEQQTLAVQEALVTLSENWRQQRRYDLQKVGEGLEVFQLANQSRFRESQQLMEQLARSINVKRDQ